MPEKAPLFTVIAGTVMGMPACNRCLTRGHLSRARLQHVAHHDVVDLLGIDSATCEPQPRSRNPRAHRR